MYGDIDNFQILVPYFFNSVSEQVDDFFQWFDIG